jgi:hypothetical protein
VTVDLRCERVVNLCDRLASFCDDERSRRERMLAGGDGGKEAEAATLLFTSLGEGNHGQHHWVALRDVRPLKIARLPTS